MTKGIDSREAWGVAIAALLILSVAFGSPYVVTVALKRIAADLGGERSLPSAAGAMAWLGTGVGGLAMGLVAERIGTRATVVFGATMVGAGLALSSLGEAWQLFMGHGLLIGLLGNGAINAPLYVYVSRWFEARRGTAVALISSGQYAAGAIWPPMFEQAISAWGWRQTMLGFAVVVTCLVVPLALIMLKPPPEAPQTIAAEPGGPGSGRGGASAGPRRLMGLPPNLLFGLLCLASFLCCIPMAMPSQHLIAFCGDLGMAPAKGAAMLSLLLVCAFASRQFWGWLSDRVGGLLTLLICSGAMAMAVTGFLVTQDEAGLFAVAAAFGLGFSGLIPAYLVTARKVFPAHEASWRMPGLLLTGTAGMATGGWIAGLIYDHFGSYKPAFATGLAANLINFAILAGLVIAWRASLRTERHLSVRPAE
ncbi:MAG: MFS transporter [Hyphomicrobiaceae bacterium]|nr:MFS transporter [Hyphomicrobiaceae bacterium]